MALLVKKFLLFILLTTQIVLVQADEAPAIETFDLENYKGKIVYLDFWASWCVPCRKSFPWMNQIRQEYSHDDLVIIAINLDKKWDLAEAFLKEYPANFDILYDPRGTLAKQYQLKGMPSSIVFDREGKPVSAHTGFFLKKIDLYNAEIKQLVSSSNQ